ncbi:MAG: hypothetical protein ACO1SV_17225 [Fimbriimonas sp.]
MKNQSGPNTGMAWEAPLWLRDALAYNGLPPDVEEDDQNCSDEVVTAGEHSLGFV